MGQTVVRLARAGCLACLWSVAGCSAAGADPYEAAFDALSSGSEAPSRALLADWGGARDGRVEPETRPGWMWLRLAWHAAAVGRSRDAQSAIDAAMAADARLVRVADALAGSLPTPAGSSQKAESR